MTMIDVAPPADSRRPRVNAKQRENCARKQTFLSETLARNTATLLGWRYDSEPMSPYRCPVCRDWHLTSSSS